MPHDLVFVGAAIQFAGGLAYLVATIRGRTKPNRVTWLLLAIIPSIGVAAALSGGAGWAVLPTLVSGLNPALIFLASFVNKNAYWKTTLFDYVCGAISALAIVLWVITSQAALAVLFAIVADFVAGIPTLLKAWRYPETEVPWNFAATMVSVVLGAVALNTWSFTAYGFQIYLFLMCGALVFSMERHKLRKFIGMPVR